MDTAVINKPKTDFEILDLKPPITNQTVEIIEGLKSQSPSISPKYFYNQKGSELFHKITQLDEYYLTRTERKILTKQAQSIADAIGKNKIIIEPGSGSSEKIKLLLPYLDPDYYIPMEISSEYMVSIAGQLKSQFPELDLFCIKADYTHQLPTPEQLPEGEKVAFFPGSTIGNFKPSQAKDFLSAVREMVGFNGNLLIGIDLKKSIPVIEQAYNDSKGITADFNLNMLTHINDITRSNFDIALWQHEATYNNDKGCVEMYLMSKEDQEVSIGNEQFEFKQSERIHTESCYKFTLEEFNALLFESGFSIKNHWTDDNQYFSLIYCEAI